jgi:hypothetical protein
MLFALSPGAFACALTGAPTGGTWQLGDDRESGFGQTGGRVWKSAEVDHRVPLFRVWSEDRDTLPK